MVAVMFAALRASLSRSLLIASLDLTRTPITVEGIAAMTIFEQLASLTAANAALAARVTVLESNAGVDTSGFATADSVVAISARVDTLEGEVGTPPADTPTGDAGSDTIDASAQ